jgi:seryl-tRNA synthetase
MLDIKIIRENPELVRQAIENRHDTTSIDEILRIDVARRQNIVKLDALRQERKTISKEREKAQERGRALRGEIQALEDEAKKLDFQLEELLLQLPNIPQPDVPIGNARELRVVELGQNPRLKREARRKRGESHK